MEEIWTKYVRLMKFTNAKFHQIFFIKVLRRPAVDLSSDTLQDILTFFDRKRLTHLRSVDSRFNRTIQREFSTTPYLLFKGLRYWPILGRTFFLHAYGIYDHVYPKYIPIQLDSYAARQILASRFVRFSYSIIYCDEYVRPARVLSLNHLWQTCDITLPRNFKLTKFYARRFAKSKKFESITFYGRVNDLRELFPGNIPNLNVVDSLFTTSTPVPWQEILDFLLRPGGTEDKPRSVVIRTRVSPNMAIFLAFIDSVKQRFSSLTTRLYFKFSWIARHTAQRVPNIPEDSVENRHTQQHLRLKSEIAFNLSQISIQTV
ncbi:hypothetical protein DdX_17687 [Ditylenchus destructor]|uniref:F-box domain-containing protein n=1 Tax=Ditylenchus destructor TaxID=166010 RepID=A0AAD4MM43_9BILA|nr:hypothetical protein DdX_17687 [Ditylenchus destructor]